MAGDARQSGKTVPDDLSGLVELVRLLARQVARDAVAASIDRCSPIDLTTIKQPKETSS
jgi:hypothetical protein